MGSASSLEMAQIDPKSLFGLIVLNKPAGMGSRRAVDLVERLVRPAKVGHAGTLDPLASGVLVACVGPATRLIEYVQQMPKRYSATFLLGRSSPTEDLEGLVTPLESPPIPSREQLLAAIEGLTGPIVQRPPAFSALKVDGRRAYELARAGKPVELAPRPVTIHELRLVDYAYPEVRLDVVCSAGTYVRSLGRDLAESLGTAAVMSALVRTAVGAFRREEAVTPRELTLESLSAYLLPAVRAVPHLTPVSLSNAEIARLARGLFVAAPPAQPAETTELAGLNDQGRLVCLLRRRGDETFGATRNFVAADTLDTDESPPRDAAEG